MCRCCQPYQRKLAVRTRTNNLTDLRSATPPDSTAMSGRRSWQVSGRPSLITSVGRGARRSVVSVGISWAGPYRSCACSAARCRAAHSPLELRVAPCSEQRLSRVGFHHGRAWDDDLDRANRSHRSNADLQGATPSQGACRVLRARQHAAATSSATPASATPRSAIPDPVQGHTLRRPILGGLINTYEPAA
jgi:hypothetical protein